MRRFLLGLAAAALVLAGCSQPSTDPSTLTIYSGRSEELVGPLFDKFTMDTGITVNARYGDSAELAAQILEEGDNRPADLFFSQDAGALSALSNAGVFRAIDADVANLVPAQFRASDNTWMGISGRARVFVYNPKTVTQLPTSVLDLTSAQWQGRIGIAPSNASFQAFVTGLRIIKGDDVARDFLAGMKKNAVLFEKNSQILEAVENGEIDLGLVNHYYWFERAAEVGEAAMTSKFAWFADGDPGNLINVAGVGIISDNPAAATFVQWLTEQTAQEFFVTKTAEYSLTGLPQRTGLPAFDAIAGPKINLADLADLQTTLNLIAEAGLV